MGIFQMGYSSSAAIIGGCIGLVWLFASSAATNQQCNKRGSVIPEPILDTRLKATRISILETWSDLNCIQKCFRVKHCIGVNVKPLSTGSVSCETLASNTGSIQQSIKEQGWKHYSLIIKNTCSAKEIRIDDLYQKNGYRCLALENIALRKKTGQSSTKDSQPDNSGRAVDGNKANAYSQNSCTHTSESSTLPWWRVDFGEEATVKSVYIVNRGDDSNQHRLGKFTIYVGSHAGDGGTANIVCQQDISMAGINDKLFTCSTNLNGRYLHIKSSLYEALTLCEVEVYGKIYCPNELQSSG